MVPLPCLLFLVVNGGRPIAVYPDRLNAGRDRRGVVREVDATAALPFLPSAEAGPPAGRPTHALTMDLHTLRPVFLLPDSSGTPGVATADLAVLPVYTPEADASLAEYVRAEEAAGRVPYLD